MVLRFFLLLFICIQSSAFGQINIEKVGVLILAHGGSPEWNKSVIDATGAIKNDYPVEVAFGMALPRTMQEGIDKLESQGVNKIIVVPLFISSYSFIIRQNEYLFGLREELADPPLIMDHDMGMGSTSSMNPANHSGHETQSDHTDHKTINHNQPPSSKSNESLDRLKLNSSIVLTEPLNSNPLVADILFEHIQELSLNPSNEIVIIVGHGPVGEKDNVNWTMTMEDLADQIKKKQSVTGGKFNMIFCTTVRDDADKAIYNQAKENLRSLVRQAGKEGDVIIVPQLLSKGGIEKGIVDRLEGLEYKWNGKTLAPHKNISLFIKKSVDEALSTQ
jgi:hypothetical protein